MIIVLSFLAACGVLLYFIVAFELGADYAKRISKKDDEMVPGQPVGDDRKRQIGFGRDQSGDTGPGKQPETTPGSRAKPTDAREIF